jgi:hypothetical protein
VIRVQGFGAFLVTVHLSPIEQKAGSSNLRKCFYLSFADFERVDRDE